MLYFYVKYGQRACVFIWHSGRLARGGSGIQKITIVGFFVSEDSKNNNAHPVLSWLLIGSVIVSVIPVVSDASEFEYDEVLDAFSDRRYSLPRYKVVRFLASKCRRNGVVWSGGVASRFSDRISPRPVRHRWERDGDDHIHCDDVDAFRQLRVSDLPMIR